jgi:hypothetical protein
VRSDDPLDVELLVDSTCVMGGLKLMAADKPSPKSRSMFFISVRNRIKAIKEILQDMNVKLKAHLHVQTTASELFKLFCIFDIPTIVHSDRGSALTSELEQP